SSLSMRPRQRESASASCIERARDAMRLRGCDVRLIRYTRQRYTMCHDRERRSMNKAITDLQHPKMLLDPYASWAAGEGVPITEDFGVDLRRVPTAPWGRFGVDGGIVHLKGRGDFVSMFVLDLAPGAQSAPQRHLFEEVVYVLSGHGNTTIEASDGRKHSFEWGPKSLFALPLNARYQHFNSSGRERARLASTNNLPMILNLFHNERFVFDNSYSFPEREGAARYFSGEGEFIPVRPGRNMWETNFVPDLAGFELKG